MPRREALWAGGSPSQRLSEPEAAAGLHFRIIPVGFNVPLEFLMGFTFF